MRRYQAIAFLHALALICVVATVVRDVNASPSDLHYQKNKYKAGSPLMSQSTSKVPENTQIWSSYAEADSASISSSTESFNYITQPLSTVSQCTATETAVCPSPKCGSSETLCPSEIYLTTTAECPQMDTKECPVASPCKDPSHDQYNTLNPQLKQGGFDNISPEYTTAQPPEFDCGIIPTTETVTFSKTRAGPVETIATYETLTKTPTVTNTVYTSCMPECTRVTASDVTETTTTARHTEFEVTMQCNSPPIIYTDTLTLYSTQLVPVRNVDTVTITVTPEEPTTYFTSTYYYGTYADKVVEDLNLECVVPPPCQGYEATTVTKTETIETTTLTDTLCLDNWSIYQVTTTMTDYSCFNPFSIYACPDGGVCPLPTTITKTLEVAESTVTLTNKVNNPCIWERPPLVGAPTMEYLTSQNPPPNGNAASGYTITVSVEVECSSGRPSASSATQLAELIAENNQIFREAEQLIQELILEINSKFPNNRLKNAIHADLLDRLSKAKISEGLENLRGSDLTRLVSKQKVMILSLSRFAKDDERIKANPKLFFDQLEVLVKSLEKHVG